MLKYVSPRPSASAGPGLRLWSAVCTSENRDALIWARGTASDDDSGVKASAVPKRASVSSSAERARGRRRGPRPGLEHRGNPSRGRLDAPPRPQPLPGRTPKVSVPVTAPPPLPALGLRSPVCSPEATASPGPGLLRHLRRAVGPGHSPASRAVHRLRPEEKEGRASRESPAYTSAAGANRRPLRQAAAPPMGGSARQSRGAAGGPGQSKVAGVCQPWEKNGAGAPGSAARSWAGPRD